VAFDWLEILLINYVFFVGSKLFLSSISNFEASCSPADVVFPSLTGLTQVEAVGLPEIGSDCYLSVAGVVVLMEICERFNNAF